MKSPRRKPSARKPRDLKYMFYKARLGVVNTHGKITHETCGEFQFSSEHLGEVRNMIRYLQAFADWAESKKK